ncbi:transposase [Rhodopila sp.]|uniref:transposase n=1 Tax=Rhodopila sp. TaxID=2480087 RepID=UPI003D0B1B1F
MQELSETIYCAWGEMDDRIKKGQPELPADRTSGAPMRANQFRLRFASLAYALLGGLHRA